MNCPRCQHENPASRKFSGECGARLASICPACGASNPPSQKFCGECGAALSGGVPAAKFVSPESYTPRHLAEKILTSKSALEGERKQVTVLFVDVSGFTSLSEGLDPEEVHGLMSRAFELMLAEVHRYEGTVNQFLGDGIMALFGAPVAHEDHARRAVHAALGIRNALDDYQDALRRQRGISFHVRQGLNTGLVVVGSIGSDFRMDYTAVGDTTNIAARLQGVARAGQIVISEATHRLVGGYFDTPGLGDLTLKGKAEPVRAWEVMSARMAESRLDVEAKRGLTPFVGRDRELRTLFECFEKAREGHGQVMFLAGEPGIGKSRLLLEFRRRLGGEATWLEGRTMSFGGAIAFYLLIDLLRRHFGIQEGDAQDIILEKIEQGVLQVDEELRPTLPFLRDLFSVDPGDAAVSAMDPQLHRAELFTAVRRLVLRMAKHRPAVVVCEDVHWMDKATEEFVGVMADSVAASPVLMILSHRPGFAQPFGDRTYHTRLTLTTLSTADSVQMAHAVLASTRLPADLEILILRRAEGNPFFVEEVIKSLLEAGAIRRDGDQYGLTARLDEIVVPNTVQDVIMARIDRLPEAPKKALQVASVIGREFTRRLLDRIVDARGPTEESLRELKAAELIYEKSLFPELGYMFKHALTQEVAYTSLLIQQRKVLHHAIARAIEELYADRLVEQYEVLAYHFSKAQEWNQALGYLVKAAEKAARAFATREAITLYDQAADAAGQLRDEVPATTLMGIYQAKADLYLLVSDFDRAHTEHEEALRLARRIGDRLQEGTALVGMGFASFWGHQFDRALAEARQGIAVAEALGAQIVLAGGHLTNGLVYEVTGRLDDARHNLEQAITIGRSVGDVASEAAGLVFAAELRGWEGRFAEAAALYTEGLRLARAHQVLMPLLEGLFMYGITLTSSGDYDEAFTLLQEGLALAEKVGDENFTPRYLNSLGWLYIECGDLERAIEFNRRAAEGARKRGDHESFANAELNLGDILFARGDLALAQEMLEGVHHLVRDPATSTWMQWRYSLQLAASLGELWLARGNRDRAQNFADRCTEAATRTNSRKYVARGWRLKGELALADQQWEAANVAFQHAISVAREIGNPTQLWKTYVAVGRLHHEGRNEEAARAAYQSAREVIDQTRRRVRTPELRVTLENAVFVHEVYALSAAD